MIDVKIIFTKYLDKTLYAVVIAGCSPLTISASKARELISAGVPTEESK